MNEDFCNFFANAMAVVNKIKKHGLDMTFMNLFYNHYNCTIQSEFIR